MPKGVRGRQKMTQRTLLLVPSMDLVTGLLSPEKQVRELHFLNFQVSGNFSLLDLKVFHLGTLIQG